MATDLRALLIAIPLFAAGCVYRHTVEPLDVNFDRTPVVKKTEDGDIRRFKYNVVDVQWHSNAIGDIAAKNGFKKIHYADLETFSILGIWTQNRVHIYGE